VATSGSVNFSLTRDEVINLSLKKMKVLAAGETAGSEEITDASDTLDMMLKVLQMKGLKLWLRKRATMFLALNDSQYGLGTAGDHATYSYTRTQIKTAAVSGATSLDVDATSGMAASDFIGIELDDGSLQWTTVSSVTDSDTVVIPATGLTSAAAEDNYVYFYRTKIDRPLKIAEAFVRSVDNNDRPVRIIGQKEYLELSNKTSDGAVVAIHYDPQLTTGQLYVWPQSSVVTDTLELVVHRPIEDMDASTNDFDVPAEWLEAIVWNLALRLLPDYAVPEGTKKEIKEMAPFFLEEAMSGDIEHGASVQFGVDIE
jgi:hypothetical protein